MSTTETIARLRVLVLDTLRTWSTAHSLDLGDDIENRVAVAVNADMIPDLKYTLCWINQLSVFKTTTTYEVDNAEVASVTVQCGLTHPPLTITLGVF